MARMQGDTEAGLVSMCFNGFIAFHQDYQKNKDLEDQVKIAEVKDSEFLKHKNEGAKKILQAIGGNSETSLVHTCFQAWTDCYNESINESELQDLIEKSGAKLSMLHQKNKASGMSAMERAKYALDQCVMLRGFGDWMLFSKVEGSHRSCQDEVEAKRQQLLGVQSMFRNFATQMESGLKASQAETDRNVRGQRIINQMYQEHKDKLTKSEGTLSLPDINHKPSSGRKLPSSGILGGQSRTPTSVGGGSRWG